MIYRKRLCLPGLLLILALFSVTRLAAQSTVQTPHFSLFAEAGAENALPSLSRELELRFEVYNDLFRFNPAALPALLKVRVFMDPGAYRSYIIARTGTEQPGAVYLHYTQNERRELVVLRGSPEEPAMLSHQAFIQFLRGFIPNPPAWIREGFAIYFNGLKFDAVEGKLNYDENLAWLETIKGLGSSLLSPRDILMADTVVVPANSASGAVADRYSRNFQICSWALVSFLLNSGDYFRTLSECFMVLSPQAQAAENSRAVMDRFSMWTDFAVLDRNFRAYLDSRKTFTELMEEGRKSYDTGNAVNAELYFMAAMEIRPNHYGPYYYLGLIYYEEMIYDMAEEYYKASLEYGADEALVSYALGVNAASAGRISDAQYWLERAASVDPGRYKTRVEDLLRRIQ